MWHQVVFITRLGETSMHDWKISKHVLHLDPSSPKIVGGIINHQNHNYHIKRYIISIHHLWLFKGIKTILYS